MAKRISAKYREQLEVFNKKLNAVRNNTGASEQIRLQQQETPIQKKDRIKKLLADYRAFASFYFPHYCKAPSAKFHIELAETLHKNPVSNLVRKWARGHAKSVNAGIIIPAWLMLKGSLKFMVLASNNETNAVDLLSDLQAELEGNEILINDFGELKGHKWEVGNFITSKKIRFKAIGRGQSPRGLRNGADRPDYILCDDLDDDRLVQNPKLTQRAYDWMIGALKGCFDLNGGRFVIVGNLISKTSILQKACDNPSFDVQQVNALDDEGNPSWSEFYTKERILARIEEAGYRLAQREYFHNPITEGSVFKKDWFQYKIMPPLSAYQVLVAYTDPSFKNKKSNDYKATVLIGKIGSEYHLRKAFVRQVSVSKMVDWHYTIYDWVDGQGAVNYWMEANFTQDLLLEDFDKAADEKGFPIPIQGDKRNKPNKYARIEAMSPIFERGFFYIDAQEKDNADITRLVEQFLLIEPGSKSPDDAPDAVEGAIYILNKMQRESEPPIFIENQERNAHKYRY